MTQEIDKIINELEAIRNCDQFDFSYKAGITSALSKIKKLKNIIDTTCIVNVPHQVCPLCNGTGNVTITYSSVSSTVCPTCKGNKVISMLPVDMKPPFIILEQQWVKGESGSELIPDGWNEPDGYELYFITQVDQYNNPTKAIFMRK